jgi:hypothetical protein
MNIRDEHASEVANTYWIAEGWWRTNQQTRRRDRIAAGHGVKMGLGTDRETHGVSREALDQMPASGGKPARRPDLSGCWGNP